MIIRLVVTIAVAVATAVAIVVIGTHVANAKPLPCLSKLERGAVNYRIVDGRKCWYVGERVPAKTEFVVERKQVKRTAQTKPAAAKELVPLRALAQVDDAWLTAERPDYVFEALCADRCAELAGMEARHASVPARIQEAFDDLGSTAVFSSYPMVQMPTMLAGLWVKREDEP